MKKMLNSILYSAFLYLMLVIALHILLYAFGDLQKVPVLNMVLTGVEIGLSVVAGTQLKSTKGLRDQAIKTYRRLNIIDRQLIDTFNEIENFGETKEGISFKDCGFIKLQLTNISYEVSAAKKDFNEIIGENIQEGIEIENQTLKVLQEYNDLKARYQKEKDENIEEKKKLREALFEKQQTINELKEKNVLSPFPSISLAEPLKLDTTKILKDWERKINEEGLIKS